MTVIIITTVIHKTYSCAVLQNCFVTHGSIISK